MVVIVFGLPGSGKSYFASRLAEALNADYINSDKLQKKMFPERNYSTEEKNSVYAEMLALMKKAVSKGKNVVLDATFHLQERSKPFIQEMKDKGGIRFIEVVADEKVVRERLQQPRRFSEADFNVYKILKSQQESMKAPHLVIHSTNDSIDKKLQNAIEYLNKNDD